jgi:outer membrane receptor for ferric coprogen and ferric-rhodotorulic acid
MFGDRLQLQVGVRKTDYVNRSAAGVANISETTPAYGVVYKPRKDTSIYASYIEGLEEGGTAPLSTNNPGQVLPAGISEQTEFGIRTEAFSGLSLTAAYFIIERASAYTNAANFFVLDGRTKYKGFEYSATGEIGRQVSVYLSGHVPRRQAGEGAERGAHRQGARTTRRRRRIALRRVRPGLRARGRRERRRLLHRPALHQQPRAGLDPGLHAVHRRRAAIRTATDRPQRPPSRCTSRTSRTSATGARRAAASSRWACRGRSSAR